MVSENSSITFVTAFIDIYRDKPYGERTVNWRFEKFGEIAETGIPIVVFVEPEHKELLGEYSQLFPNIKIMKTLTIHDLWVNQIINCIRDESDENDRVENDGGCVAPSLHLPSQRNPAKDTEEYMVLQNAKIQFLKEAIDLNPFESTHFAWIDFNISHIFKESQSSKKFLNTFGKWPLSKINKVVIPGCWQNDLLPDESNISDLLLKKPNWRFCGGFFLGSKVAILELNELYLIHFPEFLAKYRTLVWEINFWCWLEKMHNWNVAWYKADHNDSMIRIPMEFIANRLNGECMRYTYPAVRGVLHGQIQKMEAASASYVEYNGQRLLNTRFVNYRLSEVGGYLYYDNPKCKILTKNVCSILDDELNIGGSFEMGEEMGNEILERRKCLNWIGLEDIRMYVGADGCLKFVSSSVQFNTEQRIEVVIGKYDHEHGFLCDYQRVESPYGAWCEKNWTPVVNCDGEWFIYKWSPMEIGKVKHMEDGRYTLDIQKKWDTSEFPFFQYFRGSTAFQDMGDGTLVGVVHFSEGSSPRYYYHCLVCLDKDSLRPLKCSRVFYFRNLGVEFCIGFCVRKDTRKYVFWISQFDRDPLKIDVNMEELMFE
jgi:Bacterial protein of unknown function (HtrL_YibB)